MSIGTYISNMFIGAARTVASAAGSAINGLVTASGASQAAKEVLSQTAQASKNAANLVYEDTKKHTITAVKTVHQDTTSGVKVLHSNAIDVTKSIHKSIHALCSEVDRYGVVIFNNLHYLLAVGAFGTISGASIFAAKQLNESCVAIPESCDPYYNVLLKTSTTIMLGFIVYASYRLLRQQIEATDQHVGSQLAVNHPMNSDRKESFQQDEIKKAVEEALPIEALKEELEKRANLIANEVLLTAQQTTSSLNISQLEREQVHAIVKENKPSTDVPVAVNQIEAPQIGEAERKRLITEAIIAEFAESNRKLREKLKNNFKK